MIEKIFTKENLPYFIIGAVLLAGALFALNQRQERSRYVTIINTNYLASLNKAAVYTDNTAEVFEKLKLADTAEKTVPLLAELWKKADAAHESLSQLPYDHTMVSDSLSYLSQLGDYAYTLMLKAAGGRDISPEDREKLQQLEQYSKILARELNLVVARVHLEGAGSLAWDQIMDETPYSFDQEDNRQYEALLGSLISVSNQFQDYPSLIYDGPFSSHVRNVPPKMLEGATQLTSSDGAANVKKFLEGFNVEQVVYTGATDITAEYAVPMYSYDVILAGQSKASISLDITQEGGYPVWMLNYSHIESGSNYISVEKAIKLSDQFLQDGGYENMAHAYYENNDGVVTINYTYTKDGIVFYTDLIKTKVSLIDGTILGFEARGYLNMHHDRGALEPGLEKSQAEGYVHSDMEITSARLAVIPGMEPGAETLCYEFRGRFDGDEYLVYINASNGRQENLLKLIANENGVLAY